MNERGGVIVGFLAAIGLVVLVMALVFAGCFGTASGQPRSLGRSIVLVSYDDGDGGNDGGGYNGGEQDQRRCYRSENCRGSFSPGPFDRSPVDVHDNQICISPDCSGSHGGGTGKKPAGFFPPNPAKIPQLIAALMQGGLDLGKGIADIVITYVSNLAKVLAVGSAPVTPEAPDFASPVN